MTAFPLAWYITHRWLRDFVYRAPVSIWTFLLSGVLVLLFGLRFLLFCPLFIPFISAGQQQKYSFMAVLHIKAINKTFVIKSTDDTTWRTYLGNITDSKHRTIYYVIKDFTKVRAAATWHGHSNVYFFNEYKKPEARFDVAFPENLPVRLQNDSLYFSDDKNTGKIYGVKISRPLPKVICIRPGWCDELIFKPWL